MRRIVNIYPHIALLAGSLVWIDCAGQSGGASTAKQPTLQTRESEINSEILKYVQTLRKSQPNAVIGHYIAVDSNQENARDIAAANAQADFCRAISAQIVTVIEKYTETWMVDSKIFSRLESFKKNIVISTDILLPNNLKPSIHHEWKDNTGKFHVSMLLQYDRKKIFDIVFQLPYFRDQIEIRSELLKSLEDSRNTLTK